MTYTYTQLKQALAKMLPEKLTITHTLLWCKDIPENPHPVCRPVLDTELLNLCWLAVESMKPAQRIQFAEILARPLVSDYDGGIYSIGWYNSVEIDLGHLSDLCHASWQQHTIALAKVKVIEIV